MAAISRKLSKREKEALRYIAAGLVTKQIAKRMGISIRTAESHIRTVLYKLNAKTRAQAVAIMSNRLRQ